ncbi:hypothetical protein AV530_000024 [Patagioenas fasciata monilis]|uniref:Uncharacterized protein n=1 Tax=Patagioenas fasciata monilis TaxID=372326 RepID=A0A1V4K3A8_PATFA|nr:hypothetical protein AV530_000024 [Patagioenas fasciata monilis]
MALGWEKKDTTPHPLPLKEELCQTLKLSKGGSVAVSPVESRPLKPRFWKAEEFPGVICEKREYHHL